MLLTIGFGAALAIYLNARPDEVDPWLADQLDSKRYVHDMSVIGGKANIAAAELANWFKSLWHGRNLAGTVAVITTVVTLGFRFVAARPHLYEPFDEPSPH